MATKPTVGGSAGTWGTDLNAFLDVGHNTDGTTKLPGVAARMYLSADLLNLVNSTPTLVPFNMDDYDTHSITDTATYKITPVSSGYYLVIAALQYAAASMVTLKSYASDIYKNGVKVAETITHSSAATARLTACASTIIYMNGSTDYLQVYAISYSGNNTVDIVSDATETYFCVTKIGT